MSTMTQPHERYGTAPGLRDALRSMIRAAGGDEDFWQLSNTGVIDALGVVGRLRQLLDVAEVGLVREGLTRGLPDESPWTAHDWVTRAEGQHAPDPTVPHVGSVLRVAKVGTDRAGRYSGVAGEAMGEVREAFEAGDLPLGKADQLTKFHGQVAPVAQEEALEGTLRALLEGARDEVVRSGPEGTVTDRVRGLTPKQLGVTIAHAGRLLKPEKDQEDEDRRAKSARSLTKGPGPAGMTSYKLILDEEGAAVLDAALAALSGPVKGSDGEPDPRPARQRRADGLLELVRRGVSSPGAEPKCEKAQIIVTMDLENLREQTNAAGVTATGQVLAPSVVRRMACDAGIIPAVLGSEGEVLDLGRSVRFFTPGQRRALWMRDQGCTYPGCTMPPQWCDAHHIAWWSRGGGTDIDNAALLCERHHTTVHSRDLTATVTPKGVTWQV